MVRCLTSLVVVAVLAGVAHAETKFNLSGENTKITFVGTKPQGKHDGGFKTLTGSASIEGIDAATLKLTTDIDLNSLFSDDEKLTGHLKSPDFFNVKTNPKAKFVTSEVKKAGDGYNVTGKLTMNGKTKDVTFPAKIAATANSLTLTSSFKINRNDWGISYGPGKIDDMVTLNVNVDAKK